MKNSKALFKDFIDSITLKDSRNEIESIAYLAFENIFGLTMTEVHAAKEITDHSLVDRLWEIGKRINKHEPIQYILGEALFYNRMFVVNPAVLIPRPETEELVRLVVNHINEKGGDFNILDIGTGSGCIAVTLGLELPSSKIFATDISEEALQTATANARKFGVKVNFQKHDILKDALPFSPDVIVSNPPYIPYDERDAMPANVVEYEPAQALFVDENNPLLFYKTLVARGVESLEGGGLLAVEINERFGRAIHLLFDEYGFREIEILKDVYGKDRIVKGILSS
jgi:release factor glutamine methyltransferase